MSERKLDLNVSALSDSSLEEEVKKRRADKKAKLVSVLDRGNTGDRLNVPLPPDKYGEWVPADKMEVYRMESMGFRVDTEFASKRALHDTGSGGESRVADCIFMVCDRETKDIIDEIRRENYEAANRPRGGKQKEEGVLEAAAREAGLPLDDKLKSRFDNSSIEQIRDAITSKD